MRKSLALSLILVLAVAGNAFAGAEARMTGKIIDAETKQPIKDAVVKVESTEAKTFKQETKAKADGTYAVFILDGTIRYKVTYSAPGYAPYEEVMKLKIGGEPNLRDIELMKAGAAGPGLAVAAKDDPSVAAYNEGAALANAGDLDGALAKFEAAVAAKPDLMAGWMAVAKTAYKQKNHQKAIDAAKKVVDIDDSDADMWAILYASYTALGDKANAAIAEKKMPANAGSLFNEAARQINAGNDAKAEELLRQAVTLDEKFAQAHYELGMCLVRGGKNADAKAALTKYLELEPNGKDAPTAKEMLNYIK